MWAGPVTFTLLATDATSPCKNLPLWLFGAPRTEARAALAGVGWGKGVQDPRDPWVEGGP